MSHEVLDSRLGVDTGKPLSDMRDDVASMRATAKRFDLPPIVLATLRGPPPAT